MAEADLPSITIEYCFECGDTMRAVHETEKLLFEFEERIKQIVLVPSDDGAFEVSVGDRLVFSRKRLGRNADTDELVQKVGAALAG